MELLADQTILTPADPARRGGFVTVQRLAAGELVGRLRERGVWVDARRDRLRFGPAPYVTDDELERAVSIFHEVTR